MQIPEMISKCFLSAAMHSLQSLCFLCSFFLLLSSFIFLSLITFSLMQVQVRCQFCSQPLGLRVRGGDGSGAGSSGLHSSRPSSSLRSLSLARERSMQNRGVFFCFILSFLSVGLPCAYSFRFQVPFVCQLVLTVENLFLDVLSA